MGGYVIINTIYHVWVLFDKAGTYSFSLPFQSAFCLHDRGESSLGVIQTSCTSAVHGALVVTKVHVSQALNT